MNCKKTWFAVALACAGCSDDGDEDTGAGTTDGSATQAGSSGSTSGSNSSSSTDDDAASTDDDAATTGATASDASTSGGAETDTGHHETEGHDVTTAADDSGSGTTSESLCDVIGEGCHDNATPEGIECHLLGHDGDEAACANAYEMCADICGL